ncbi:MAG TPA: orotate phosphoribosyltransferase [Thermoanaerobaculia bacterium]
MITLQDFIDTGALLEGHFRLSSGLHSDRYLQCARLLMWPERAAAAGKELAGKLSGFPVRFVVAPAMGGIIIGHEVARAFELPFVFAERQNGAFALRRGFRLSAGDPVVVIEDVFTTGKSTREVIALVAAAGAKAIAAGSIVDRGLPPGALGIPSRSLLTLDVPAWSETECPLCAKGVPLDTPGSRYAMNQGL